VKDLTKVGCPSSLSSEGFVYRHKHINMGDESCWACVNVIIVESFEPRLALYKKIISKGYFRQG
jgi:hypothetical protein